MIICRENIGLEDDVESDERKIRVMRKVEVTWGGEMGQRRNR